MPPGFAMNRASKLRCGARIIAATCIVFSAQAQTSPSPPRDRYLVLSYFKSKPDRAAEHARYERAYRKPVYEQQVRIGRVTYWKLFAVQSPDGKAGDYEFVTAVECARSSKPEAIADLHLPQSAELGEDTAPSTMVRQDLLVILESTANWSAAETRYLRVRYMQPRDGKSAALATQERTVWKPYYEDAVRIGVNTGWAFTEVRSAGGHSPYTRVWFSGMAKFGDTDGKIPPELTRKWEPKLRALPRAAELRSVVRDELWRLLDQTPDAR
jgi:hypothetical protein